MGAVRAGKLIKTNCENCGSSRLVQGHHEDYDKPKVRAWYKGHKMLTPSWAYGMNNDKKSNELLIFSKDFKENGHVAIQSCNITGELKWGKPWKIPDRVESIARVRGSSSTILVSFEGGWQLSFRLHNASSRAEPSLKFDIRFIGLPQSVARHEIIINQKPFGSV